MARTAASSPSCLSATPPGASGRSVREARRGQWAARGSRHASVRARREASTTDRTCGRVGGGGGEGASVTCRPTGNELVLRRPVGDARTNTGEAAPHLQAKVGCCSRRHTRVRTHTVPRAPTLPRTCAHRPLRAAAATMASVAFTRGRVRSRWCQRSGRPRATSRHVRHTHGTAGVPHTRTHMHCGPRCARARSGSGLLPFPQAAPQTDGQLNGCAEASVAGPPHWCAQRWRQWQGHTCTRAPHDSPTAAVGSAPLAHASLRMVMSTSLGRSSPVVPASGAGGARAHVPAGEAGGARAHVHTHGAAAAARGCRGATVRLPPTQRVFAGRLTCSALLPRLRVRAVLRLLRCRAAVGLCGTCTGAGGALRVRHEESWGPHAHVPAAAAPHGHPPAAAAASCCPAALAWPSCGWPCSSRSARAGLCGHAARCSTPDRACAHAPCTHRLASGTSSSSSTPGTYSSSSDESWALRAPRMPRARRLLLPPPSGPCILMQLLASSALVCSNSFDVHAWGTRKHTRASTHAHARARPSTAPLWQNHKRRRLVLAQLMGATLKPTGKRANLASSPYALLPYTLQANPALLRLSQPLLCCRSCRHQQRRWPRGQQWLVIRLALVPAARGARRCERAAGMGGGREQQAPHHKTFN